MKMDKSVIIGALVGFGLLAGSAGVANVASGNLGKSSVPSNVQSEEKPEPIIKTKTVTEIHEEPFKTEARDDATLAKGTKKVVQEGEKGISTVVYEKVYEDDVLKRSKVISSTVTKEPVNKVVINGTYEASKASYANPEYCPNGTYINTYGQVVCRPS